jgi:alpha-galactosidase
LRVILIGFALASLAVAQIPTSGLQVQYAFSDGSGTTVTDSSGNARNGATNGSPKWIKYGGMDFAGPLATQYVLGPILNLTGNRTIAFEMATTKDGPGGSVTIVGAYNYATFTQGYGVGMGVNSTNVIEWWNGAVWSAGTVNVNDEAWHSIIITVAAGTTSLYVDGALDTAWTIADPTANTGVPLALGTTSDGGHSAAGVQLSHFDVWNRALTGPEIAATHTVLAAKGTAMNEYAAFPTITFPVSAVTQPDNGLERIPGMRWVSWYYQKWVLGVPVPSDAQFRAQCAKIVSLGLRDLGYYGCSLTEPGVVGRTPTGDWISHYYPDFLATSDYAQSLGLTFGIYASAGKKTCQGYYGSGGNETADAIVMQGMEAGEVQYDWCTAQTDYAAQVVTYGQQSLLRQIYQTLNQAWPVGYTPEFGILANYFASLNIVSSVGGNYARYSGDTQATWGGMTDIFDAANVNTGTQVGIGRWPLPDILGIGTNTITETEGRTQMSIWSILSADLQLSMDLTAISAYNLATISNTEVIAVDQDPAGGVAGAKLTSTACGAATCEVWGKKLTGTDTWALVFLNRDADPHDIVTTWAALNSANGTFTATPYTVTRNLWTHLPLGTLTSGYTATAVPAHGVSMVRLSNTAPAAIGAFAQ